MGILNDLKRLFFGASSVAKHSAERSGQYLKDEGEELLESAKTSASKVAKEVSDRTAGLKQSIEENSKELYDKAKQKLDDLSESETVKKAADFTEKVGDKILTAGEKLVDKASEVSFDVGEKLHSTGEKAFEKGKKISEEVGSKILDVADDVVEKAKESASKIGEKLNETMDKADKWAAEEKLKPKKEFADDDLDASGSLLEGKDDFFSKASQYADGKYDAFSEGKITIDSTPKKESKPSDTKATGFEDMDGDGNELIDDAIVDEDGDEPTK